MISIRSFKQNDFDIVSEILNDLDLLYLDLDISELQIAIHNHQIIGIFHLKTFPDYAFLSAFGIIRSAQNKGFGSELLKKVISITHQPIYLYTISPQFFEKSGFKVCKPPKTILSQSLFECHLCEPENCKCMIFHLKED